MSGARSIHSAEAWEIHLRPGDLLFVRGVAWISRQILSATRCPGEPPTQVSHVGLVDTEGTISTAEILEAVGTVRRTTIAAVYARDEGPRRPAIAIARCLSLTEDKRAAVVAASRAQEGRAYGWGKIALQLFDAWFGRALRRQPTPVFFRRLSISPWPICSVHVAKSFAVAGIAFGLRDRYANPDDIWDGIVDLRATGRWVWVIGPELAALPPHRKEIR